MSSKLVVVGDSYCMNYIKMRNQTHLENKEPYLLHYDDKTIEHEWQYKKEFKLWPEIVAQYYNLDLINLSESGAGNYSIFSMALDSIVTKKPKKLIVVWSGWDRFDFEADEVQMKIRLISNSKIIKHNHSLRPKNNTRTAWIRYHGIYTQSNEKYNTNCLDEIKEVGAFSMSASINMFMRLVYSLQETCKSLNIDLQMFQSVRPFSTVLDNEMASKKIISDPYIDKIDENIFKGFPTLDYIGGKCFSDILHTKDFRFRISEHDGHPNEEGHKKIASYVAS